MKLFLSKLFTIILFVSLILFVYFHEQTHVQINESYGINSRVEYFKDFPDVVTYGDKSCPNDSCILAHKNTDNIGYQLQPLFLLLGIGLLCIIILLENREEIELMRLEYG